jgi:hypothetical protein
MLQEKEVQLISRLLLQLTGPPLPLLGRVERCRDAHVLQVALVGVPDVTRILIGSAPTNQNPPYIQTTLSLLRPLFLCLKSGRTPENDFEDFLRVKVSGSLGCNLPGSLGCKDAGCDAHSDRS